MTTFFYELLLPVSLAGCLASLAGLVLSPALKKLRWRQQRMAQAAILLFFLLPIGPLVALLSWNRMATAAPQPANPVGQALSDASQTAHSAAWQLAQPTQLATQPTTTGVAQCILLALPWVWLVGALVYTGVQLRAYLRFRGQVQQLAVPAPCDTAEAWRTLCLQAGYRGTVAAYSCEGLPSPMVMGLLRPTLYLPANGSLHQNTLAMQHELQHMVQGDILLLAVVRMVCRLHWFNPLCHWQGKKLRAVCELSCDERSAQGFTHEDKKAYGKMLLLCAGLPAIPGAVSCFGGAKRQMQARLEALFQPARTSKATAALVALLVALALVTTACAAGTLSDASMALQTEVDLADTSPSAAQPTQLPESQPDDAESQPDASKTLTSELEKQAKEGDADPSKDTQPESGAPTPAPQEQEQQAQQPDTTKEYTSGASFAWPVPNYTYVSRWMNEAHKGADLCAAKGAAVVAMEAGTVITAQWHTSYGYYAIIDHGGEVSTLYAHLDELWVEEGQSVSQAQQIGTVGATGNTTGNSCHVEVHIGGARVDLHDYFSDK